MAWFPGTGTQHRHQGGQTRISTTTAHQAQSGGGGGNNKTGKVEVRRRVRGNPQTTSPNPTQSQNATTIKTTGTTHLLLPPLATVTSLRRPLALVVGDFGARHGGDDKTGAAPPPALVLLNNEEGEDRRRRRRGRGRGMLLTREGIAPLPSDSRLAGLPCLLATWVCLLGLGWCSLLLLLLLSRLLLLFRACCLPLAAAAARGGCRRAHHRGRTRGRSGQVRSGTDSQPASQPQVCNGWQGCC